TLRTLLDFHGSKAKAIVWAHNSDIGDAAATEMAARGEYNIGHLCREEFGNSPIPSGLEPIRGWSRRLPIGTDRWRSRRCCPRSSKAMNGYATKRAVRDSFCRCAVVQPGRFVIDWRSRDWSGQLA